MPTLQAIVPDTLAPERVDRVALGLFAVLASLSQARKLARKGALRLDGLPVPPMSTARPGQVLEVDLPDPPSPRFEIPLEILHVDDWLAVVYKPAGLLTSGPRLRTLAQALPALLGPSPLPDAMASAHPVHRLDARVQGPVLCARSRGAAMELGRSFQEGRVEKRYRALVVGSLDGEGEVELAVDGRSARTSWRSVEVMEAPMTGSLTTVDLWPLTGRRHQLRQHLASLGHPVLGDGRYAGGLPVLRSQGLMLAAVELRLEHPGTGVELHIEVPEPARFVAFRERARRRMLRLSPSPG
jgi:23S rRNA pseudouridine1911/1915/1917 synthase